MSHCPLMIAAVEEILEYLEEEISLPVKSTVKDEEVIEVVQVRKRSHPYFTKIKQFRRFFQ